MKSINEFINDYKETKKIRHEVRKLLSEENHNFW